MAAAKIKEISKLRYSLKMMIKHGAKQFCVYHLSKTNNTIIKKNPHNALWR